MKLTQLTCVVSLTFAATGHVNAQDADIRPTVTTNATGSVKIQADYAILTVGVNIQDSTPSLAAVAMDARLAGILDTLLGLGFPRDSLPTAGYNVRPNTGAGRRIVGYTASSGMQLSIWDFDRLPVIIEAVLAAGATDIRGLGFATSNERQARNEALRRATEQARQDAEVLAVALGGRLGDLVEVSTGRLQAGRTELLFRQVANASGPGASIVPRVITVTATVTVRWAVAER